MTRPDPSNHRVLLVGPRVVHLKPLFDKRGYPVVAAGKGVEGMAHLDTDPCDLVILELNLGDLTATEFLMAARQGHPRATFLLLDEATRAGQIVKALQAGLDGYLATPPDEDRLFYEVERHFARAVADDSDSGFEESSTQTTMTTIAEVEALQVAVADRDSQVIELQDQLNRAQQLLRSMREEGRRHEDDARRLHEVQQVLAGQLETSLDADEAMRLRERLGLAQVADIELQSLRIEAEGVRNARRELEARLEEALRELKIVRAADAADAIDVAVDDDRVESLQSDIAHLNARNDELQASLQAAREALAVAVDDSEEANSLYVVADASLRERELEVQALRIEADAHSGSMQNHRRIVEEYDERVGLLDAEIARLNTLLNKAEAAVGAVGDSASREVEALRATNATQSAEIARLNTEVLNGQERLARAQAKGAEDEITRAAEVEDAIATAVDLAVERERVRLGAEHNAGRTDAVAAAVALERTRLQAAHDKALAAATDSSQARLQGERTTLQAQLAALELKTRDAEERALDIEFQLEEARTRVEFLEEDAQRVQIEADERVQQAELSFKKEKLRLVEEKQTAASGSQEAVLKMDRFIAENAALKRSVAELSEQREQQAAAVVAAEDRAAEADRALARAVDDKDVESARAASAVEAMARAEAVMGGLQRHARDLEVANEHARLAANSATDQVMAAEARATAAESEKDAMTTSLAALQAEMVDTRTELLALQHQLRAGEERAAAAEDRAAAVEGDSSSVARQQLAQIASLERENAAKQARLDELGAQLVEITDQLARLAAERAAEQSSFAATLGQARREAESTLMAANTAAVDVEDAIATVRADARREVERVSEHAQGQQAQQSSVIAELQGKLNQLQAERAGFIAELPGLRNERERLLSLITRLEAETISLRDQLALASSATSTSSQADAALSTVRSLLEGVDPLRWGLGAAIDYLYPFEGNDQSLASHIRNLRLLQATLARLSAESGKSTATG